MILGTLLTRLENGAEAEEAIAGLADAALTEQVAAVGARFGETPGEYVACAASRFAASAQHEEWMGLIAAVERAEDPGKAALDRILRWALASDRAEVSAGCDEGACSCSHGG